MKRYRVDFYDMFDGWINCDGVNKEWEFDDFEQARQLAEKEQKGLDEANKKSGEHYGVIDTQLGREIYCLEGK